MKRQDIVQWIATLFVLMMQLALNTGADAWVCIALSVCSSITWLVSAVMMNSKQLLVTNSVCLLFGMIGVVRII